PSSRRRFLPCALTTKSTAWGIVVSTLSLCSALLSSALAVDEGCLSETGAADFSGPAPALERRQADVASGKSANKMKAIRAEPFMFGHDRGSGQTLASATSRARHDIRWSRRRDGRGNEKCAAHRR